MPFYTYHCDKCDEPFEKMLPMSQYDSPQGCPNCGDEGPARKTINAVGVIFKGDGWVGKDLKIGRQMAEKNRRLDSKQEERKRDSQGISLTPNVGGERTETWSDAAKLAKSKGKNTEGYEKRAQTEKPG